MSQPGQTVNLRLPADIQRLELPSAPLHVTVSDATSAEVQTVLFVHGLGGSSSNYAPLINLLKLEDDYRVITFDLEGHGLSPLTGREITLDTYVRSIKEVLDHFKAERSVVVGHSMGAFIVTSFAAAYPGHIRKLVLLGPVKEMPETAQAALTARASEVRAKGMSAIATTVATNGVSAATYASSPLAFGYVLTSLLATPAEGYARACLALANAKNPQYNLITAPVLILAGTEDKTSPAPVIDFLEKAITASQVERLDGIGHWQPIEDVNRTATLIKSFL